MTMRIRIRFGFVWMGKFDLNTLRMDGNIFESGNKKLRIQKYPDTCGRSLIRKRKPFGNLLVCFLLHFKNIFNT